eukprot:15550-Heterococcus_DN1.PRE.2
MTVKSNDNKSIGDSVDSETHNENDDGDDDSTAVTCYYIRYKKSALKAAKCRHAVFFTSPVATAKKARGNLLKMRSEDCDNNDDNDNDSDSEIDEQEHDEPKLPTPPETSLLDTSSNKDLTAAVVRQHWLQPAPVQVVTSGKLIYSNGNVYTGTIKVHIASDGTVSQGIAHGFGTTMKVCGSYHTGYYHDGAYEGYGEYTEVCNGKVVSKYQGNWAQGQRHGKGAEKIINGTYECRYEGTWSYDARHGSGSRGLTKSDVYATSSCISVKNVKLSTGEKYTGTIHVENGAPHGYGIATSASGSTYDGSWVNGARNYEGKQTVVDADGNESSYTGIFVNDERQGHGIEETANDTYVGDWHGNKRHGEGVAYTELDTYIGSFVEGMREGDGTLITASGNIYKGKWRADALHGAGVLYIKGQEHAQQQSWDSGTQTQ